MFARGLTRFALVGVASGLVGCADTSARAPAVAADSIRVGDDAQRTVSLHAPARRVISLMPAVTDMLLAIGAQDRLIARTQFDIDPRIAHLPSTGNALTPSLEWIVSLKPDLVITWPDQGTRSVVVRIAELGIPVYAARTESIADVVRTTRNLGTMLGIASAADSAARSIESQLARVRAAVASFPRVRAVYVLSLEPLLVAGPGTYISELLAITGGDNVFPDLQALWPQVNLEELIKRKPEVIVLAPETPGDARAHLRSHAGWRELDAVRAGRVLSVDVNLFNRPGPNMPQAAIQLARFFHSAVQL